MSGTPDVAIVGGGIVGLAIAWRLAQRGTRVVVHDPGPPEQGAWHVAAGMLAPGGESPFERPALGRLMAESARRWPGFATELGEQTGRDLGYDEAGTLGVALTVDDVAEASRVWRHLGLNRLGPSDLRGREPALSPRVRAGAYVPDDRQVDPRRVVDALRAALGAAVVPVAVNRLDEVRAGRVVVAAGCGTAALTGLPVRPVKGQLLRLRGEPGTFRHVVSGYADGRHVYLVPRADGEVVVGATQEERTDRTVTAGGVLDLLRAALDLVPALREFALTETMVGHRPATPDNAPLLGALDDRTVVAAGHHRNGVLLTPVTADLIADLVITGTADPLLDEFQPGRFACV
ncbi:glycine oxidase ThiO [Krasilnikovia sp. M28-CT-15]|uniref:glycine oxidase ThiO n=1 Tax=Krasilnikovia sp. M28-CT-15 TaxID=3373540 RepID=UPI0038767CA3